MSNTKTDIKIYADILEPQAAAQAYLIAGHPCLEGPVRIMPDAHAGAGCVIGFTGRFASGIVPNVVGVDIGCGVTVAHYRVSLESFLKDLELRYDTTDRKEVFDLLDRDLREVIPTGPRSRPQMPSFLMPDFDSKAFSLIKRAEEILKKISPNKFIQPGLQLGTLGGGNHFIEIDRFGDERDGFCLVVHSGSRNLGHKIGTYFQNRAKELARILKNSGKDNREICDLFGFVSPDVPNGLEYLPFVGRESEAYGRYPEYTGDRYMECAAVAQEYAALNRRCIVEYAGTVLSKTIPGIVPEVFESVHNYIGSDGITRKGAIRAEKGERVVIPLSMKDGIIIGRGKGNEDWNCSAPHGAGRLAGRSEMKRRLESGELSMEDFHADMEGIYTSSVTENTIDESSFAYKPAQMIIDAVAPTMEIENIMKPLFNLKDTEPEDSRRREKKEKPETIAGISL